MKAIIKMPNSRNESGYQEVPVTSYGDIAIGRYGYGTIPKYWAVFHVATGCIIKSGFKHKQAHYFKNQIIDFQWDKIKSPTDLSPLTQRQIDYCMEVDRVDPIPYQEFILTK